MHRVHKGEFGYIRQERRRMILITSLLIGGAVAIYGAALILLGTNANYFTILAVLLMLPGARYLVNTIMFFRARPCSEEVHQGTEAHIGTIAGAYDLYMTSQERNYAISHLAVGGKSVAALTEDPQCDTAAGEQHIRKMMQTNGFHGYSVKIFTSPARYYERLDQLNRLEGDTAGETHGRLIALMESISL